MTAKTFNELLGYTDDVLKGKPIHKSGEDLRDLPTYTIPEAALFLGISPRTAGYWFYEANNILAPSGYAELCAFGWGEHKHSFVNG